MDDFPPDFPEGFAHYPGYFSPAEQADLIAAVKAGVEHAPFYIPRMPRTGQPLSVAMSNFGTLGWVTDKDGGYRYDPVHPKTKEAWPEMPQALLDLWRDVTDFPQAPEACLINFYDREAKMGLHQDRSEEDFSAPVISISLGETCRFRAGENVREGRTASLKVESGDIIIMGGKSRLCFHGVDRIYPDTSTLLKNGGRINLTLRRVTEPE